MFKVEALPVIQSYLLIQRSCLLAYTLGAHLDASHTKDTVSCLHSHIHERLLTMVSMRCQTKKLQVKMIMAWQIIHVRRILRK